MADDLTRWNRAGLSRFRYVNGNAATYLEQLRSDLQARFPRWPAMAGESGSEESEQEWQTRLENEYQADKSDMLWQLNRSFARACHVFGEHLDVYANEASLGTATEWDNIRKLVAQLDYHPQPPASAHTPLAITAQKPGRLEAGFAVKHSPTDGAPIVFETLSDLQLEPQLNQLRALDHNRNPDSLQGHQIELEGLQKKLTRNTPIVLENTRTGDHRPHFIQAVALQEQSNTTQVTLTPAIRPEFTKGDTRVHVLPKEQLEVKGPATPGSVKLNYNLRLKDSTGDLKPDEVVVLSNAGHKSLFVRIDQVHPRHLNFKTPLGNTYLEGLHLSRPLEVPLSHQPNFCFKRVTDEGDHLYVVFAAGDWSWLQGSWVARRPQGQRESFPHFRVIKAHYRAMGYPPIEDTSTPEDQGASEAPEGYTALTLEWKNDGGALETEDICHLAPGPNPQYLLAAPKVPGPWQADPLLERHKGALRGPVLSEPSKHARTDDFAVVVDDSEFAWAKLSSVGEDKHTGYTQLHAEKHWRLGGGGPLYRDSSRVYVHFTETLRPYQWQRNDTKLSGRDSILLDDPEQSLAGLLSRGRRLIADNGNQALSLKVSALEEDEKAGAPRVLLSQSLPEHTTASNLVLYANVVSASHGSSKAELALGSGDATERNPEFEFKVQDISFVPDASQASGVRAAIEVTIDGRRWEQIANLKDAGPEQFAYTARPTEDGTLKIGFGDGRYGRRLPTGNNNIKIRYRQGVGARGNLPAGTLTQPQRPHSRVKAVHQPLATAGGADRETEENLRQRAPATLLTLSRAVSLKDFARMAQAHASIWQARAFALPTRTRSRETLEVVVVPAEGADLSSELGAQITRYLHNHALPGVALSVVGYQRVFIGLEITLRIDLEQFEAEPVIEAVRAALLEHFSLRRRQLGQPLYRGEVYQVVEAIPGVANSTCEITLPDQDPSEDDDPSDDEAERTTPPGELLRQVRGARQVIRVLHPGPRQCLHLNTDAPEISINEEPYQP